MAKKNKFTELLEGQIELQEAEEGKPRRIRFREAMTADIVNGNGRRYSAPVLDAAVVELRSHLNESAGQGRIVQVLGEAEHPSDKPTGRPNLLETVIKWDEISFDGKHIGIVGRVLETSKGQDFLKLMEGGVMPGVSMRGYGEGKTSKTPEGDKIFEVSELHITGFDPVLNPSFQNSAEWTESKNFEDADASGENEMSEELLNKLQEQEKAKAELQQQLTEAQKLIADGEKAKQQLEESKNAAAVQAAIEEATKDLPFGKELNEAFTESIKEAGLTSADAVKKFAENKRKEYGKLAAKGALKGMGFDEKRGIVVLGDVLENETGTPEFARASFEITESVRKSENRAKRALDQRAESPAAVFTEKVLKQFDLVNQRQLLQEARAFTEAEAASDLNLPYSVMRAVIAEAYPNLVAANVFDFGIMEGSPTNIFYEAFSGETGYSVDVTDEAITLVNGSWVDMANKNIVPGTFVLTDDSGTPTYTEGTDFVVDYELGKIKMISDATISTNLAVEADYTYHATRKGEGAEIERGKMTLSYQTVTAIAYRLAAQINSEAIVFSRSQLGYDAVTRTIVSLINQIRRDIDRAMIEKGVGIALSVSSNIAGTWDISDAVYADFAKYIGMAKVKVANRYYTPTSVLMSMTNSDYLSNWDGFKNDGFPNALLNAAGFAGSVKGLPVFASTEMRDTWNLVSNRELVMHRVLQPMTVKGPFPTYGENRELIAAEQYYVEEYNGTIAPIGGKGSLVKTQA